MYARLSTLLPVAAFVVVAAAAPNALEARQNSQCNTGPIDCCDSTYSQSNPTVSTLAGLLGIVLPDVQGLVGINCTPVTGIGAGSSASCTQQPVCCTGNDYNGLINVGCTPINVNA